MAKSTQNLGLILPSNNEFFDAWDVPINENFTLIDTAVGSVVGEVAAARGSAPDLATRLTLAMDTYGNPNPPAEMSSARVSTVYGGFTSGAVAFGLNDRIEEGDREVFFARQSQADLISSLAVNADYGRHNTITSAPANFLTYTGRAISLNGSTAQVVANINGYQQIVRYSPNMSPSAGVILTTTLPASGSGTQSYYLTLTRSTGGSTIVTGSGTGSMSQYTTNSLWATLTDSSVNFSALGVRPGDVLKITAPSGNPFINQYVVLATHVEDNSLSINQVAIKGQFTSIGTSVSTPQPYSGLSYTISNPLQPTLGYESTAHPKVFTRQTDKIYIGRCSYNYSTSTMSSFITYATNGSFSGFSTLITPSSGSWSYTFNHNLGYFPSKVSIFASTANDFSAPLDLLSVAEGSVSTSVTPSSGTATAISTLSLTRSCALQMTDLLLTVKNSTSNGFTGFYKDILGATQSSGYLYVQVER